jgi:hypothetical protein
MSIEFKQTLAAQVRAGQLTHPMFLDLLVCPTTRVHVLKIDANDYGEWLFVTLSAVLPPAMYDRTRRWRRRLWTFFGLGYHDARERWLFDSWMFYAADSAVTSRMSSPSSRLRNGGIGISEVLAQIQDRRAECMAEAARADAPSGRARLYGVLADLTDDDGALAELADFDAFGVDLADGAADA